MMIAAISLITVLNVALSLVTVGHIMASSPKSRVSRIEAPKLSDSSGKLDRRRSHTIVQKA